MNDICPWTISAQHAEVLGEGSLGPTMSYRLKLKESVAHGLRRIALDQIEMAEEKLRGQGDAAGAVHDARRCLKRLRALLRLPRPGLDEAVYQREAKRLSATGRLLAGARDGHVMLHTLRLLQSRYGPLPDDANERLTGIITASDVADPEKLQDARRRALARLGAAAKFFRGPDLQAIEMAHVLDGMERVYKKARRGRHDCDRKPSDEAFHTWRKAVQAHWRHMQLLSRAWPDVLMARAVEAKELSQLLGEDHDLAVLLDFARRQALSAPALEALETQCRGLQHQLRALADLRGTRLLAESPEDLRAKLATYWNTAKKLHRAQAAMPAIPDLAPKPADIAVVAPVPAPDKPPTLAEVPRAAPSRKRASA